ncbi:MAG TPA: hypothetical protein VFZ26_17580 [Gemmatimonadales bacterium]
MRQVLVLFLAFVPLAPAAGQGTDGFSTRLAMVSGITAIDALWFPRAGYAGRDEAGVPRYVRRPFDPEERALLRRRFGIEDPSRLYLSDSSSAGYLVYDTERDPGAGRLVRSYRIGAPSVRREDESWEELERRLRAMRPGDFPRAVRTPVTSLDSLAPEVRDHFVRMVADARTARHRVRVAESWRSPERQAYLMAVGGGLTFTATSMHSSGHAADLVVGDGDLGNPVTRARWIAFRRWLAAYDGGRFRMIGTPERSWDWPHVDLAEGVPGYESIEALLDAARAFEATLHSSHDPARGGTAALPGAGGRNHAVFGDGAASGAPLSAR